MRYAEMSVQQRNASSNKPSPETSQFLLDVSHCWRYSQKVVCLEEEAGIWAQKGQVKKCHNARVVHRQ